MTDFPEDLEDLATQRQNSNEPTIADLEAEIERRKALAAQQQGPVPQQPQQTTQPFVNTPQEEAQVNRFPGVEQFGTPAVDVLRGRSWGWWFDTSVQGVLNITEVRRMEDGTWRATGTNSWYSVGTLAHIQEWQQNGIDIRRIRSF